MGVFPETINFLKGTQKFSIFKLVTLKLVPRHIVFCLYFYFGGKRVEDPRKVGQDDLLSS